MRLHRISGSPGSKVQALLWPRRTPGPQQCLPSRLLCSALTANASMQSRQHSQDVQPAKPWWGKGLHQDA